MSCAAPPLSDAAVAAVAAMKPPSLPVLRGRAPGGGGSGGGAGDPPPTPLLARPSLPPPVLPSSSSASPPPAPSLATPSILPGPFSSASTAPDDDEATLASSSSGHARHDEVPGTPGDDLLSTNLAKGIREEGGVLLRGTTTTTTTSTASTQTTAAATRSGTTASSSSFAAAATAAALIDVEQERGGILASFGDEAVQGEDYIIEAANVDDAAFAVVSEASSPRGSGGSASSSSSLGAPSSRTSSGGTRGGAGAHSNKSSSSSFAHAADTSNNSSNSEKIGRWTEAEHAVFLEGLERHGKQWKTIAGMIWTRTVVQVRTHAQKYFQKMDRKQQQGITETSNTNKSKSGASVSSSASSSSSTSLASSPTPASVVAVTTTALSSSTVGTMTATKRRSLPPSLPSRKKTKLAIMGSAGHAKAKPRISISLVGAGSTNNNNRPAALGGRAATISNPVSQCHSPSSDVMLSLPAFTASATSVSLENLSTISPSGVADFDDLEDHFLLYGSASSMLHPKMSVDVETSFLGVVDSFPSDPAGGLTTASSVTAITVDESTTAASYNPMVEDPLEWLLENDSSMQHLPESSLSAPMFPDFSELSSSTGAATTLGASSAATASSEVSYKSAGFAPLQLPALRIGVANHHHNHQSVSSVTTKTATNTVVVAPTGDVTDNLPYADPKVTVQALFMVDDKDGDHEPNDVTGSSNNGVDDIDDDIDVDMEEATALLLP